MDVSRSIDGRSVDTRWFQTRLADARLSQRKLARHLGVDPAAVSLMFRGKRKISAAEAGDIARFLGVSVTEVLLRAGVDGSMRERPQLPTPCRDGHCPPEKADKPAPAADVVAVPGQVEIPVALSGGGIARLILPARLNVADAERIAMLVKAFATPS